MKKGDEHMAVLAKPSNKVVVIEADKSKDFIEQFNKNVVTEDFLKKCKKAGDLFKKKER